MPTFSKPFTTRKGQALVPTAYLATIGRTDASTILRVLKAARIKPDRTLTTDSRTYRFWGSKAVQAITEWREERDGITAKAPDTKETVVEEITHAQPESDEQRFKALADALHQTIRDLDTTRSDMAEIKRLLGNILEVVTRPAQPVVYNAQPLRFAEWPNNPYLVTANKAAGFTNGQLQEAAAKVDG